MSMPANSKPARPCPFGPTWLTGTLTDRSVTEFSSRYLDFTGKRGIARYADTRKISTSGVMGDPTRACAEKGQKTWEIMVAHLVALVEDLQSLSLAEIYHRKF
jgi:creatinine amidohydrolase/Fe(II)-dependent formamide hydrolase-like protein